MDATIGRGRALVVGLGIAGMATALRLHQIGWEPVLIERAPARREDGQFIALFGAGTASAHRLGVLDAIGDRSSPRERVYEVNRAGRRTPTIAVRDLPGNPRQVLRSDIERALFDALPDDVEIRYSTVPTRITQNDSAAEVTLRDTATGATATERFDLVVGADGMRSTVRGLAFGPGDYLHPLNHIVAGTFLAKPLDGFTQEEAFNLIEPGRSAWTFAFADHPPALMFTYRTTDVDAEFKRPPNEAIRAAFGPQPPGEILEGLFTAFENAPGHLFDSVNQVKMPNWHQGRVVLVGDAAWTVTLYAGTGAASALAGGELLGTMLQRHPGDLPAALRAWEARMRPFIAVEQERALIMRRMFLANDRRDNFIRAATVRIKRMPAIGPFMGKIIDGPSMNNKNMDVAAV